MFSQKQSLNAKYTPLFIALMLLSVFFLQYTFRSVDDNRLTSWQWTFAQVDLVLFVPVLILGIIAAYFFAEFPFYRSRPALFLFLFSFAAGAVFWSEPEVIVDTSRYFTQAKHLELYGMKYFFQEWGKEMGAWTDMPLASFLYGMIFRFFGESRIYIQVFTSLLFSMTVVLTFFTGKTLWDEDTGFQAGLLLAGIPYLFSQIPLMLTDVPTMFFLILSIFTFCTAMERGGVWIAAASVAAFCAVFSKYSTWMMMSVLPVIWLVYLIEARKSEVGSQKVIRRGISVTLIAGILIAIAVFYKFDVIAQQIKFLQEYQAPGLKRWSESFISTFCFQSHPLITLAALYSLYEAARKRDMKYVIICWLILFIVLFQIKRSRYVLAAFPMLTLMASYGLQGIKDIKVRRFIAFGIVSSAIVVAVFSYLPFLQGMSMVNIKNAGEFLNSSGFERINVRIIPSAETEVNLAVVVPILDLYTKKEISYREDVTYSPSFEEIREAPLRFTWEFQIPRYYRNENDIPPAVRRGGVTPPLQRGSVPIVVISNGYANTLPVHIEKELRGYGKNGVFDTTEGIFGFNPFVTVYLPEK
jgi:hypothetical protein